ncbi:MAG: FAD:protein FMN transferase [Eubacteriales bacterium]
MIGFLRKCLSFFLPFVLMIPFFGCETGRRLYSETFFDSFDTVTTLRGYADSYEQFEEYVELARTTLLDYHRLYDIYEDYDNINNLKTVNDHPGQAVTVDSRILDLLEFSVEMYNLTDGMTNIAMGSVLELWHEYRTDGLEHPESAAMPPMELLTAAAKHTDIACLQIDRAAGTVCLCDPDAGLDVGAVAKGYAAGKTAEILREAGFDSGILNVGGNTVAIGSPPDGSVWRIGIQNPGIESEDAYLLRLGITDRCLVTSGSYERYYLVDGIRYHHIIHPDTLMPEDTFLSVSVLSADSGLADALSTALFNMDADAGRSLVDSLDGVEACWILPDGRILYSSGFDGYIQD